MAGQNFKIGVDDKEALDAFSKLEKDAKMFESTMVKLGDKVDNVFEATNLSEYKQAISSQISVVEALTKEYDNLVAKRDEWASKGVGKTFTNEEIKQQQAEYANFEKQLKRIDKELQSETKELEKQQISLQLIEKEYDKVSSKSVTYLTQLKNIREEMATMVDASGNVSTKDIDRYNELKGKLGELGTAYRRVQQEQKLVTQAGNSMVLGITQGLQAIAGTFTLIQGLSSLISSDSEDVAEAQKKLQQAMAITMGIQQVSVALHSTSNLRIGLVAKATNLLTIAQNRLAIAFNGSTIAARAFMGAVTLGLGVAITAAVTAYNKYADAQEKAYKIQKEIADKQREIDDSISKSLGGQLSTLKSLQLGWDSLGNSLLDKKKYIKDNAEAFKSLGYEVGTVSDAESILVNNTSKVIEAMQLRAEAAATKDLASEEYKKAVRARIEADKFIVDSAKEFDINGNKFSLEDPNKQLTEFEKNVQSMISSNKKMFEDSADEAAKQGDAYIDHYAKLSEKAKRLDLSLGLTPKKDKKEERDEEKRLKDYNKLVLDQSKALAKDREELERSQIDKRIKMLQYDYEKRIKQIRAEKDAILKLNKNADISIFEQREQIALEYYEKEIQKESEAQEKKNKESLSGFKSYYEQRQDIIDKYNKHIDVAKSLGLSKETIDRILKEQEKELSKFDFAEVMKTQDISYMFEDISKKSTESIKVIIEELKRLRDANIEAWSIEELKIFNDQISKGEDIARDRSPLDSIRKGLEEYQQATEEVEYVQKQINKLDKESVDYNEKLAKLRARQLTAMDSQTDAQKKINNAVNNMGRSVKDASSAMTDVTDMLANFGITFNDSVSNAIKGIGQMGDALANLDISKPGSIITSSIKWMSGIGNIVSGLFGGGGKRAISESTLREYEALTSSIERSISAQKELLTTMAGAEAQKASDEAIKMLNRQKAAAREMYVERVDVRPKGGTSIGVKMQRDLKPFKDEIEAMGISWDDIFSSGRMEGLAWLSGDQLKQLRDIPQIWAAIDDEAKKHLETVIETDEAIQKLPEELKEALTGVTFEGFLDSVTNELSKFKGDIQDLGDFTEETLKKALINAYKQDVLRKELAPMYDRLSEILNKKIEDLSPTELEDWSKDFEDLLAAQTQDFKAKLAYLGIDIDKGEMKPPKASQGYQVSMSQDTGDEILGLVRNMQMIGLNQEQELINQTEFLSTFGMQFGGMQQELESISNVSLQSMYYLRDIEKHTKTLHDVGDILSKIEKNTQ